MAEGHKCSVTSERNRQERSAAVKRQPYGTEALGHPQESDICSVMQGKTLSHKL